MNDTERLAALLDSLAGDPMWSGQTTDWNEVAARLIAAGVRVEDVGQEIHDVTCPDCAAPRIDPDRLRRALDNYVLPPMDKCLSYNDAKREVAAAIIAAYEEEG